METLLKWMLEVMHLIIIGLFYLLDLVILILLVFSDKILALNIDYNDYKVVIILIVLFISYIVGLVINKVSQRIIWLIKPKHKEKFEKVVESSKPNEQDKWKAYYLRLIMVRHLIISIPSLGVFMALYLLKFDYCELSFFILLVFIIFTALLFLAYRQLKIQQNIINSNKE